MPKVKLQFFKVEELPTVLEANSVYFVKAPDSTYTRECVTDENGNLLQVGPNGSRCWRGKINPDLTLTPIVNSLGEATIEHFGTGLYRFICPGAFPDDNKIFATLFYSLNSLPQFFQFGRIDDDTVNIRTFWCFDDSTLADIDHAIGFFIEVYD